MTMLDARGEKLIHRHVTLGVESQADAARLVPEDQAQELAEANIARGLHDPIMLVASGLDVEEVLGKDPLMSFAIDVELGAADGAVGLAVSLAGAPSRWVRWPYHLTA
jgi:hypothetical protein